MALPIVYHPNYIAPLPEGHRFPMSKFRLLYERLLEDDVADLAQFHLPERSPLAWLELVHTPDYVQAYCDGTLDAKAQRRIGLPWSSELVQRTCIAVGGSVLTAKLAYSLGWRVIRQAVRTMPFPAMDRGFVFLMTWRSRRVYCKNSIWCRRS